MTEFPSNSAPWCAGVAVLQVWVLLKSSVPAASTDCSTCGDVSQDHAAVALSSLLPIPLTWGNKGSLVQPHRVLGGEANAEAWSEEPEFCSKLALQK